MSGDVSERRMDQFKGCMAGVLLGDCLGKRFGNKRPNTIESVISKYRELIDTDSSEIYHKFLYTDDTQMTISVAKFLAKGDLSDYGALPRSFVEVFEAETLRRGYGPGARKLLSEWRRTDFQDLLKTSQELYKNQGSFGNGCGMKISPAALYTIRDPTLASLVEVTSKITQLTHIHPVGLVGGLFQTLAVRIAFLAGESKTTHTAMELFGRFELDFMKIVRDFGSSFDINKGHKLYLDKLDLIRQYLNGGNGSWTLAQVKKELGNLFSAPVSVPTAFFCFLASFDSIPEIEAENQFERTIFFATSLGGDADTITSMAAAICGAYLGLDKISSNLYNKCEDYEGILKLAEELYDRVESNYVNTS